MFIKGLNVFLTRKLHERSEVRTVSKKQFSKQLLVEEMFYLNAIEQLFLFVEQLDQLEV